MIFKVPSNPNRSMIILGGWSFLEAISLMKTQLTPVVFWGDSTLYLSHISSFGFTCSAICKSFPEFLSFHQSSLCCKPFYILGYFIACAKPVSFAAEPLSWIHLKVLP